MNSVYETILASSLGEDVKGLFRKWHTLSANLRATDRRLPALLPDLFWIVPSGAGKTTFLRTLTDYLQEEENLMDFYGDVDVFEFLLEYCSPGQPFTELQRLMDTVKNAAGFRNDYRGVMCIDIDAWKKHYTDRHFVAFMEYLAANSRHWMIVLCVTPEKDETLRELQAFLSMYLRLETLHMAMPSDEELVQFLERHLAGYGLTLTDDAVALLQRTFAALRTNKHFDGYKSAHLLAGDILYHLYAETQTPPSVLDSVALASFADNSQYVEHMLFAAATSRKTIGF